MKLLLAVLLMLVVTASADQSSMFESMELEEDEHVIGERAVSCGPGQFQCSSRYGHCIQEEWVCDNERDCFNGHDERNCTPGCTGEHKFKCNNERCVPIEYRCDGNNDCHDYSDEINCHKVVCSQGEVKCDNFLCIEEAHVCDGRDNCGTGWDEINCTTTCKDGQFMCKDRSRCIDRRRVCDSHIDCQDQSDETVCICQTNEFQCQSGRCVPETWECDGENDCGDFSDEHNCGTIHPTLCFDMLLPRDCAKMNDTAHPICLEPDDGPKYCRKFCGLCIHT